METKALKTAAKIAYFSMEIGLDARISTYAGGLGVLAGDILKSCADLQVPVVAVSLVNGEGFFTQALDAEGNQTEETTAWSPGKYMTALEEVVTVPVEGRTVYVKAWLYLVAGVSGYNVPVIFLDTDMLENEEKDRSVTGRLYGGDLAYRFKQEIVLGIGGVRMLDKLGFHISKYHMNEGHSSLLTLELVRKAMEGGHAKTFKEAARLVKSKCIFTTHTPVESGHDGFPYDMVGALLGGYMDVEMIKGYCCGEYLNMTLLGFGFSDYINGVAKKHARTSQSMFPTYSINSVTNGVHADTWTSEGFKRLYDRYMPDWRCDPYLFRYAVGMPDKDLWEAHQESKNAFIGYVNGELDGSMEADKLTLGFARRMTEYKRPNLLFSDVSRLREIARKNGGIQIAYSGKAHPEDVKGKRLIKELFAHKKELSGEIELAYIPDYGMDIAKKMVSGVDLWINTPEKPMEASGTSGMKATLNGVLNMSVLDGWWIEGCIEDVTGWSIEPVGNETESATLYRKLENAAGMFYLDRQRWINMMRSAISLNASFFNSHRTVQQYIIDAYWD